MQEGGGITEVLVSLLVLCLKDFENAEVAFDSFNPGLGEKIGDPWALLLAEPVHTPVPLLEDHERPGQIEVDQAMAEVVEVEPFGGHIGTEQNPYGIVLPTEAVHELLLLSVRHTSMQNLEVPRVHRQLGWHGAPQPFERLDAF